MDLKLPPPRAPLLVISRTDAQNELYSIFKAWSRSVRYTTRILWCIINNYWMRFITPPARRAWRSTKFAPFLFYFFPCRMSGYRSWVIPLAFLCCLAHCYTSFKPFYSRICLQNTHFNVDTEISKQKQGSPWKKCPPKMF